MNATLAKNAAQDVAVARAQPRPGRLIRRGVIQAILIVFSIIFSIPFYWLISTSLKTNEQINALPIIWIPNPIITTHYVNAFQFVPLGQYILNTLVIAVGTVVGAVVANAFTAYGLARIDWPLAKPLFMIFMATLMIPFAVTMIPLFILFKNYGWIDTFLPLIVPTFFGNAFFIFLLRQFFMSIPNELSDAARIDGAHELQIFARVVLPLTKPALATVALFQFIASWTDFLGPLIYLSNHDLYTVSIGLAMFKGEYTSLFGPLMAGSTVMILPVIILFFLTQRTFIEGITLTGIKG